MAETKVKKSVTDTGKKEKSTKRLARRTRLPLAARIFLFEQLIRAFPEAKTELEYLNPYTFLVAVVLSARMTDKGVNKATALLFKGVDTPEAMLALGEDGLKEHIKTVGLYKTKAKHIMQLSRILVDRHGSEVPHDFDALTALPGVGRKSANVILNVIFHEPTFPVDTHVGRVSARTGLVAPAHTKTPEKIEAALRYVVPKPYHSQAHHVLVLHGRYVCTSQRPRCQECCIREVCLYHLAQTKKMSAAKKEA